MIKTDAPIFGRLVTAMVTPFDDDLKIDIKAVDSLVDHLIGAETKSIVVSGTTGESPTLEDEEKKELLKRVVARAKGKVKVIMGAGYNSTARSVHASREAQSLGADGILAVAPYYNKPSQTGLLRHFEEIANAVNLPIIIYNIPGRTGVNVSAETTIQLANTLDNVHAVKDSTGSTEQSADIGKRAKENFYIYSGDDYLTLPFLSIGGCGVVSVASHLIGKRISEMMGCFFEGKVDRARKLHYECLPLFKGLFVAPNPTCVKYALSVLGLCKPHLRLPLVSLDAQQKEIIDKLLNELSVGTQLSCA